MPLYWIILLVTGITLSTLGDLTQRSEESALRADASAIAHNLIIYRNALAEYAHNNSGITGLVPDNALSLPAWYVHLPGINGYVASGDSFTFYVAPPAGLMAKLAELTNSSAAIGYASAGRLISATEGATDIVIPAVIPNGAAVAYR